MPQTDERVEPPGGRHRLAEAGPDRYRPRHPRRDQPRRHRLAAVTLLASIGIGAAGATITGNTGPANASADSAVSLLVNRARGAVSPATAPAVRQATGPAPSTRAAAPTGRPSPGTTPSTTPAASPSVTPAAAKPTATPSSPATVAPVGGLTSVQMGYAKTIVEVGKKLGLPRRAYVIAIATALQESRLYNLANWGSAESLGRAHDGIGSDYDSVGLFQQRPSSGWGSVAELMDPATSARKFYQALMQVGGWQNLPVTVAAQTVQGSAFPDAYAPHEQLANLVVDALG